MNILLCLSHSIEESQQLQLLSELGYGVASIGGYIDPSHPHDPKRPPLPNVPMVPAVKTAVDSLGTPDNLGAAQSHIPDAILEWLGDDGVIIYHHYLDRLYGQWPHIRDWLRGSSRRRVIWRSVGQSVQGNEETAKPFRAQGLERVAYSPKEANIPGYSGHDALIRFWGDPEEYKGWTGEAEVVINITQHLAQRDPYTNYGFWEEATRGLVAIPLGPGSEAIGGPGELGYDTPREGAMPVVSIAKGYREQPDGSFASGAVTVPNTMKAWLRTARAYLYTGTQPASYTLGLIEAMMTGIPVVSIGPQWHRIFPYGPDLFEGHEIAELWEDRPDKAREMLDRFLRDPSFAEYCGSAMRTKAIELFGKDKIAAQWKAYLG